MFLVGKHDGAMCVVCSVVAFPSSILIPPLHCGLSNHNYPPNDIVISRRIKTEKMKTRKSW